MTGPTSHPRSGRLHHAATTLKYPTQQHETMHASTTEERQAVEVMERLDCTFEEALEYVRLP